MEVQQYFETPVIRYSKEEDSREGTPLLVVLHGYGADENDLFALTPYLPANYTVAAVRAPLSMYPGFTWFPLDQQLNTDPKHVVDALTGLDRWVEKEAQKHTAVDLLGFSMGMSMATSLARMAPERYRSIVGLSGFAIDASQTPEVDELFDDAGLASRSPKLPMFWGRDQEDPVIPQTKVEFTHGWVRDHVNLTKVLYANMGHGINQQELGHIREFLDAINA